MKTFKKRLSELLITAVITATMAVPAMAGSDYNAVTAQDATFTKYLLVDSNAVAPSATFNYTISSAEVTPVAGTADTLPVYQGTSGTTAPAIAAVTFAPGDTADATSLAGKKTYKKTITISMNSAPFTEPGVYRYYIQETTPTPAVAGMYYDVDAVTPVLTTNGDLYRTLDIYVEDNGTDNTGKLLKVTGYIMYDGKVTAAPPSSTNASSGTAITGAKTIAVNTANGAEVDGATKTDNYVNYYTSQKLTFGKVVTGNQGSRDKYFKVTLKLTSPVATTLSVDVSHADSAVPAAANLNAATDSTFAGTANPTSISLTAGTEVSTDFYLQHGQYIIVNDLPIGTAYALSEVADGYTSTNGITQSVSVIDLDNDQTNDALNDAVSGTIAVGTDIHTGFTNDKQGVIPTGVLVTLTPVIVIAVIVVAGIAFFVVRSAKRKAVELSDAEAEEENE